MQDAFLKSMNNSHESFKKAMLQNPKVNHKKLLENYKDDYTNALSKLNLETAMKSQELPHEKN